jgi:trehalose-6-phosphate synthase
VPAYRRLHEEIVHLVAAVNAEHGDENWTPVRLLAGEHDHASVLAYYRLADVCVVSSLHDGMNLVAKEFVAARPDGDAALVLSRFTGAAREMGDALLVNPLDLDGFAEALRLALELPVQERRRRMASMRAAVGGHTVYDWAHGLIAELGRAAGGVSAGPPRTAPRGVELVRPPGGDERTFAPRAARPAGRSLSGPGRPAHPWNGLLPGRVPVRGRQRATADRRSRPAPP